MPLGVATHVILDDALRPLGRDVPELLQCLWINNSAAEPSPLAALRGLKWRSIVRRVSSEVHGKS
eukprot:8107756-Prorocentrum_lima.AAC.1